MNSQSPILEIIIFLIIYIYLSYHIAEKSLMRNTSHYHTLYGSVSISVISTLSVQENLVQTPLQCVFVCISWGFNFKEMHHNDDVEGYDFNASCLF